MWEQIWGHLVWGSAVSVPSMTPIGWLFLGALISLTGVATARQLRRAKRVRGFANLLVGIAGPVLAEASPNAEP
jgi:hypothetical protein